MLLSLVMAATVLGTGGAEAPRQSKKAAYLASKADAQPRRRRPPRRATRVVYAHNLRTHEIMPLTGPGIDPEDHDRFFRCWFTGEHGDVPAPVVQVVLDAAEHFDVRAVHVISGFRHPKYNLLLRKKGRQVARKSKHTEARAIDFFLPGVPIRALYDWLLANHDGGVGFYGVSEFVHVDDGRKRTWNGT